MKELTAEEYLNIHTEKINGAHYTHHRDARHYGDLRAKEAVEKFAKQLIEKLDVSDKPINFLMDIKRLAKQHGVEL